MGHGNFGKFLELHLNKFFEVDIFEKEDFEKRVDLEQRFSKLSFLIFAVNLQHIEEVCKSISNMVPKDLILIDVTSVKVEPLRIIKRIFPNNPILGTHPIFGPQSGKNGIENFPIVLCNVSLEENDAKEIKIFLKEKLKLKIIEMSPEQHDQEMAIVQGLTHFIGRALNILNIKELETGTQSYKALLDLKNLLKDDSWELFSAIQNGNSFTKKERKNFMRVFKGLDSML